MHDLFCTRINMWPISVRWLRDGGQAGRPRRGVSRKHTVDLTVQVGGIGIHWQAENRPTDTRSGAPGGFSS